MQFVGMQIHKNFCSSETPRSGRIVFVRADRAGIRVKWVLRGADKPEYPWTYKSEPIRATAGKIGK